MATNPYKYIGGVFLMTAALLSSCSENDFPDPSVPDIGGASDTKEIRMPIRASYQNVHINLPPDVLSTLKVNAEGDWLELQADTVSSDGYVEIYAPRNEDDFGRKGKLIIGDPANGGVTIPVYQCGASDEDNNEGLAVYAGCGYNIFNELNSETSLCSPVVDFGKASALDPTIIQTVARHLQDSETLTSTSLTEMADLVTQSMEKQKTGIRGGTKTVARFTNQTGGYQMDETGYAYINLQRIVACSSMDFSKVIQYAEQGNRQIFTENFRKYYDEINAAPSEDKIFNLFKEFGTHIVTYVDLGGIMDIAVKFNKSMVGELNLRADDFRKYFFNSVPSDYTLNDKIQGLSTSISASGTFKIAGGSKASRDAIMNDCKTLGRINPSHISSWAGSLPQNNFMGSTALAPINVQLVPIWSLFPQRLANMFFKCAITESQKSTNAVTDARSGLDNYGFKLTGADYMRFSDSGEESLVRVLYATNQNNINDASPVLEICNEYIPTLKGNERITVVYPIRNGRPFHGTGLYPGDGHGCGPAWLTFSEGEVYIRPVEGTNSLSVIDSIYYLHGNIYTTSLGLDLRKSPLSRWKAKGILQLPIVKIGSGYWTRRNITQSINNGVVVGKAFRKREKLMPDGEIWVSVAGEVKDGPKGVGGDIDDIYQEPVKWYYPTEKDRKNLVKYIGYDTRQLLPHQLSGLDLQFEGYWGVGGVDNVSKNPNHPASHNEHKCYLIFKSGIQSNEGSALCFDSNYHWTTVALGNGSDNFFPLRLFRTSYYIYGNYKSNESDMYDNCPSKK